MQQLNMLLVMHFQQYYARTQKERLAYSKGLPLFFSIGISYSMRSKLPFASILNLGFASSSLVSTVSLRARSMIWISVL